MQSIPASNMEPTEQATGRRLVVTICTGAYQQLGKITQPAMESYADKTGADFQEIRVPLTKRELSRRGFSWRLGGWFWFHWSGYASKLTKSRLTDLLDDYDRLLYLDCTCLIHPSCPNLFEVVPSKAIGAVVEPISDERHDEICRHYRVPRTDNCFFNAGVEVISRGHRNLFEPPAVPIRGFQTFLNQPWENAMRRKHGYPVHDLGPRFNFTGGMLRKLEKHGLPEDEQSAPFIVHMTGGYSPGRIDLRRNKLKLLSERWMPEESSFENLVEPAPTHDRVS